MIRIIIADDHTLFRAGLIRLLEGKDDIQVVGEAGTGRETMELCLKLEPDVLLLDLDMPDMDGFEVTRKLAETQPQVKILVLTMHDIDEYAIRLLQSGAKGFIVKGISPKELPDAIRKVASGATHITASVLERIAATRFQPGMESPLAQLSERELQVLKLLAQGSSVKQAADEICLSPHTVETYKARLMKKLELQNMADLIRFALRHGLINKF